MSFLDALPGNSPLKTETNKRLRYDRCMNTSNSCCIGEEGWSVISSMYNSDVGS